MYGWYWVMVLRPVEEAQQGAWALKGQISEYRWTCLEETPLASCFTVSTDGTALDSAKDRLLQTIIQFISMICPNIEFTLSDKDLTKINGFQAEIPFAQHQLCYWHTITYIEECLAQDKPPAHYSAISANKVFAFIDPTWVLGINPGWLEDGVHKSDAEVIKPADLVDTGIQDAENNPAIPLDDENGTHLTAQEIYRGAVQDMYQYCFQNDLSQGNLTGKVRKERLAQITAKEVRNHGTHHTNVKHWTCSCLSYLASRFLLCKHLVRQIPGIHTPELGDMDLEDGQAVKIYLLGGHSSRSRSSSSRSASAQSKHGGDLGEENDNGRADNKKVMEITRTAATMTRMGAMKATMWPRWKITTTLTTIG
ncbi:hypothetical protein B0H34DRAFT_678047 [Crassisporium funariophilum]|nr:hypothetical protein B0H34DRAFT_678047 [Crassisporium funariophilum]